MVLAKHIGYGRTLPVHEITIDQSYIRSLDNLPKDVAVVRSTIALGHALDFSVVAEGIETEADLAWLRESDCDIGQGCFIAKPTAAAAILDWIASSRAPALPAISQQSHFFSPG